MLGWIWGTVRSALRPASWLVSLGVRIHSKGHRPVGGGRPSCPVGGTDLPVGEARVMRKMRRPAERSEQRTCQLAGAKGPGKDQKTEHFGGCGFGFFSNS
jgi:hypothetical protein